MAKIIELADLADSRVACFTRLTEAQLRQDGTSGLFIAESPKVIRVALDAGYHPEAILCEKRHIQGDAADIIERLSESTPVFTGEREMLASLTGYTLTRGVLCAMRRPRPKDPAEILSDAKRVAVIDGVCDTTNIGAIFRSAAALGIDAVALTPASCDPLNRRAVRVSMGTVFLVPWCYVPDPVSSLRSLGFVTAALALSRDTLSIDDPRLKQIDRLALILGTEGDGLSARVVDNADYVVKIPMHHSVDSLNVAAASAVAFWELRKS